MYRAFIKRLLDFVIALTALLLLMPILIVFMVVGAIAMKGNPFFTQERPGKDEKIFKLIKFRTMSCEKGPDGKLLPDAQRLNKYGKFLRSTSVDELPELINILLGHMSVVGPRPLLVRYLPRYNERQRRRHEVRPGLTGYAQVNGRNSISWEERFEMDVEYVEHLSFIWDIKILFGTVGAVFARKGISSGTSVTMEEFMGTGEHVEG